MTKKTHLALALCLLALAACSKKAEKGAEPIVPVQVTAVRLDSIRRIIFADGVLFPMNQASVTPKVSAPVRKFYVNRGDHVRQGQLLAVLENRDLAAAARESKVHGSRKCSITCHMAITSGGDASFRAAPSSVASFALIPIFALKNSQQSRSISIASTLKPARLASRQKAPQEGPISSKRPDFT